MAHSPGEWKVEDDENGDTFVRIPGHDIFITNIEGGCGECYGNAKLIAAAPDLLETLARIERSLRAYSKWIGKTPSERELIALVKLNANCALQAIDKAKEE